MGMIKVFLHSGIFALTLLTSLLANEPTQLKIAQAVVELPQVTLYLNVLDEVNQPMTSLNQKDFQANIDGHPVDVLSLKPFTETPGGVAYFFIVDVSKSMSAKDFEAIRQGLLQWIEQLKSGDRAALYTIGDSIELMAPYAADLAELKKQVGLLAPKAQQTRLHEGLKRALELNRGDSSDTPTRRVIVLISDGQDEGSALSPDDVEEQLEKEGIPVYAIGYSRLKNKRQEYLNQLRRFTFKSGGQFLTANENSLIETYAKIALATTQVWILEAQCNACASDGQYHQLGLFLNNLDSHRALLFPPKAVLPVPVPTPWFKNPLYQGCGAAALVILIILFVLFLRPKKPVVPIEETSAAVDHDMIPAASSLDLHEAYEAEITGPIIKVELLRVKGQGFDRNSWAMTGPLTLGRSSSCDIIIPGERVSSNHCRLSLVGSHILITDAGSMNGTIVNGIPVQGSMRLESGDLLLIGDNEYRFQIQGAL